MNELNTINQETQEAAQSLPSASSYVTDEAIEQYIIDTPWTELYGILEPDDDSIYPDENEMRSTAEALLELSVPEEVGFGKEDEDAVYTRLYEKADAWKPTLKEYWSEISSTD